MSDAAPDVPADDVDMPMQARVLLWAAASVRGVLSAAAANGRRLDIEEDRDEIALEAVAAVLRHLKSAGNQIVLPEPPTDVSASSAAQEADGFSLVDLVTGLMQTGDDGASDGPVGGGLR
jgi:hypothetical protein